MSLLAKKRTSRGQTLVEYAVVIPIFLIFICLAVEVSFMFINSQRVGSLSRELASSGYRDCLGLNAADIVVCKDTLFDNIKKSGGILLKDFLSSDGPNDPQGKMVLTIFLPPKPPATVVVPDSKSFPVGTASKFSVADVQSILNMNTPVVTAEVWYHYKAITPFGKILGVLFKPRINFYEATVY